MPIENFRDQIISVFSGSTPTSGVSPDVTITSETSGVVTADRVTIRTVWTKPVRFFPGNSIIFSDSFFQEGTWDMPTPAGPADTYTQVVHIPQNSHGHFLYIINAGSTKARDDGATGPPTTRSLTVEYDTRRPDVTLSRLRTATERGAIVRVTAQWNIEVINFLETEISQVWRDENNLEGSIRNFTGLDDLYYFDVVFPETSIGEAVITVDVNIAQAKIDDTKTGPAVGRSIIIPYDTLTESVTDMPAELTISKPLGLWKFALYTVRFRWSLPVTEFTIDNIQITGATAASGLIPDPVDPLLYTMQVLMSGKGEVTITVGKGTVLATSIESPEEDVSVSWDYDVQDPTTDIPGTTTLYEETKTINDLDGSFIGISDLKIVGDNVYGVTQIQRRNGTLDNEVDETRHSRGELFSVPLAGGELTSYKKYEHYLSAARSVQEYDGTAYYIEGSHYAYVDPPPGDRQTWLDSLGNLGRISSGAAETLGPIWQSKEPTGFEDRNVGIHGGSASPLIVSEAGLNAIVLYGNAELVGLESTPASHEVLDIDNFQWVTFGKKLNNRIPLIETNGMTAWSVLEQIARLSNSFIGFENGRFIFKSRIPTEATVNGGFGKADLSIGYTSPSRVFPDSGTISIEKEVLTYTTNASNLFSDLTRTDPVDHTDNASIHLIDHIIDASDITQPVNDANLVLLPSLLFNNVHIEYAARELARDDAITIKAVDAESIMRYNKETFLELQVPLSKHQRDWAIFLASQYLNRFKDYSYSVELTLRANIDYRIGQTVFIREPYISQFGSAAQIMGIRHRKHTDEVILECFTLA